MSTGLQKSIGEIIDGRYKIIKLLGKGGFGETYLVEDLHLLGSQYAIKRFMFPSNNPHFAKARELFQREVETLQKLNGHKQIPKFFKYLEVNQEFYLLQEYIEGNTLSDEIQPGKKLKENEVRSFLHDLLRILDDIHNQNIIHRDIKPDNIIRRKNDNKLVLIDFGAVKEIAGKTTPQQTPTLIYTKGYAPEEQERGNPEFNSDIYALGIIAIVALTGLEAQNLPNNVEVFDWQGEAEVSDGLASILYKMVRYDYRVRYQSVKEVLKELDNLAIPPSQNSQTSTILINPIPVNRKLTVDMILCALLAVMFIIAILYSAGLLPEKRKSESQRQQSLLMEKVLSLDAQ